MATSTVSIVATGLRKGSNRDGSPAHGPRRKILIGISASTVRDVALSNTFSQPNSLFDHDEIAPDEEEPKSHCCPGIEDHRSQAISDNRLDKENECREGESPCAKAASPMTRGGRHGHAVGADSGDSFNGDAVQEVLDDVLQTKPVGYGNTQRRTSDGKLLKVPDVGFASRSSSPVVFLGRGSEVICGAGNKHRLIHFQLLGRGKPIVDPRAGKGVVGQPTVPVGFDLDTEAA